MRCCCNPAKEQYYHSSRLFRKGRCYLLHKACILFHKTCKKRESALQWQKKFRCYRTLWAIKLQITTEDPLQSSKTKKLNHQNHKEHVWYFIYIKFLKEYLRNLHWKCRDSSQLHLCCIEEKSTKFANCSFLLWPRSNFCTGN